MFNKIRTTIFNFYYFQCPPQTCPNFSPIKDSSTAVVSNSEKYDITDDVGIMYIKCGLTLIFSHEQLSFADAWQTCNKSGMKLVSAFSNKKVTCLFKLFKDLIGSQEDREYWTSGTFNACYNKFWFCHEAEVLLPDNPLWKAGVVTTTAAPAPSKFGAFNLFNTKPTSSSAHPCVTLYFPITDTSVAAVALKPCSSKLYFICEKQKI